MTNEQKNCPYCHNGTQFYDETSCIPGNYYQIHINPKYGTLEADSEFNDREPFIPLNYCPMCGRSLGDD